LIIELELQKQNLFRIAIFPILNSMLIRQQRSDGSLVRVLSAHTAMRLRIIEKTNYQVLLVGIFDFILIKKKFFFC